MERIISDPNSTSCVFLIFIRSLCKSFFYKWSKWWSSTVTDCCPFCMLIKGFRDRTWSVCPTMLVQLFGFLRILLELVIIQEALFSLLLLNDKLCQLSFSTWVFIALDLMHLNVLFLNVLWMCFFRNCSTSVWKLK